MDKIIGNGTGFLFSETDGHINLITNWHIVTCRDPSNPKTSKYGAIPYKLRLLLHNKIDQEKAVHTRNIGYCEIIINSKDGNNPIWFEHALYKYNTDVICIKINKSEFEKFEFNLLCNCPTFHSDYFPEVMNDVHVIGYPWGLKGGDEVLPIYKRGSIASEPNVNINDLPRFLIDCRTTEGMSGAPVIASRSGILNGAVGTFSQFAGIYSGRLKSKVSSLDSIQDISEIGIVWKPHVIRQIIINGTLGTALSEL